MIINRCNGFIVSVNLLKLSSCFEFFNTREISTLEESDLNFTYMNRSYRSISQGRPNTNYEQLYIFPSDDLDIGW